MLENKQLRDGYNGCNLPGVFLCGYRIQARITLWEMPGYCFFFSFKLKRCLWTFCCITTQNCCWTHQRAMFIIRTIHKSPEKVPNLSWWYEVDYLYWKPPDWESFKMQKYFGDPSVQVCLRYTVFLGDQTTSLVAVKHTESNTHIVYAAAAA